jgi:hypothetical protein
MFKAAATDRAVVWWFLLIITNAEEVELGHYRNFPNVLSGRRPQDKLTSFR